MVNNDTFVVNDTIFKTGDIVEKWTPERHWQYWTTIHTRADAIAYMLLDQGFHRVRRYTPKVKILWLISL